MVITIATAKTILLNGVHHCSKRQDIRIQVRAWGHYYALKREETNWTTCKRKNMIILDKLNVCPALMHFIGSKTLKNWEFQGHKVFHVLSFSIGPNGGYNAKTSPRLESFRALVAIITFKTKTRLDAIMISFSQLVWYCCIPVWTSYHGWNWSKCVLWWWVNNNLNRGVNNIFTLTRFMGYGTYILGAKNSQIWRIWGP